jgi:predicted O-methyltransferase YrrM
MEHFYHNINGWSQISEQGLLFEVITENIESDKLNIAEIGVYQGRGTSIINVILINKKINYNYYGIDHFIGSVEHKKGVDYYGITLNNLKKLLDDYDNIKIIKNDSLSESKNYPDNYFDIVYIDASHDYESVKNDILTWIPKIKDGGIICGDDYIGGWPGVVKAVNEVFEHKKINKVGNQQWWVKL